MPVGDGLLSNTSPTHLSLKHTVSTSSTSVPGSPTDAPDPPLDLEDLPYVIGMKRGLLSYNYKTVTVCEWIKCLWCSRLNQIVSSLLE